MEYCEEGQILFRSLLGALDPYAIEADAILGVLATCDFIIREKLSGKQLRTIRDEESYDLRKRLEKTVGTEVSLTDEAYQSLFSTIAEHFQHWQVPRPVRLRALSHATMMAEDAETDRLCNEAANRDD